MSLPPEILKKVKLLEIQTRKLVKNIFAGEYHSAFRGQGMTFSEFREYTPGDDVRAISWPLTARMGKPYIKVFEEERELTLMMLVDVSGSGDFGSGSYLKGEVVAHLAALLSFSATRNNDPIGLLMFSDQIEHFVPPKKGRGQVYRILRDLYYVQPKSRKTNLKVALEYVQSVLKKRSTIFIFSDFMDEGYEPVLRRIRNKHEVVSVLIEDEAERQIPDMGLVELEDPETGEFVMVDTGSPIFQREYKEAWEKQSLKREQNLKKAQVDRIPVNSSQDIVAPLIEYFKRRNRR